MLKTEGSYQIAYTHSQNKPVPANIQNLHKIWIANYVFFKAEGTICLAHATYESKFIQHFICVSAGSTLQIYWKLLQNNISD
jgi:hypothetical protein